MRARADMVGNHIFRAEVHCKKLGTRLVREETTHFYQDGEGTQQAKRRTEPLGVAPGREGTRTAERIPLPLPQSTSEPRFTPAKPGRDEMR